MGPNGLNDTESVKQSLMVIILLSIKEANYGIIYVMISKNWDSLSSFKCEKQKWSRACIVCLFNHHISVKSYACILGFNKQFIS